MVQSSHYLHRTWSSQDPRVLITKFPGWLLDIIEFEFPPRRLSLGKTEYHVAFAFSLFTDYQSQEEERSGKYTQSKLDCYIQNKDPNLVICYCDLDFGITSIGFPNSITFLSGSLLCINNYYKNRKIPSAWSHKNF